MLIKNREVLLYTPHGSHLYGLANKNSDQDFYAVLADREHNKYSDASTNFLQLQTELVDTEDKVMAARRFYNAGVRDINTSIKVFPTNLITKMLSFTPQEFFDVEDPESIANPPKVEF